MSFTTERSINEASIAASGSKVGPWVGTPDGQGFSFWLEFAGSGTAQYDIEFSPYAPGDIPNGWSPPTATNLGSTLAAGSHKLSTTEADTPFLAYRLTVTEDGGANAITSVQAKSTHK